MGAARKNKNRADKTDPRLDIFCCWMHSGAMPSVVAEINVDMFVKRRRKKLAVRREDFKLNRLSLYLMPEYAGMKKSRLFDLWAERDDIRLIERFKLEFELAESRRIDGKPRHAKNWYLASIREADLNNLDSLHKFWRRVRLKLKTHNLSESDCEKLISTIAESSSRV